VGSIKLNYNLSPRSHLFFNCLLCSKNELAETYTSHVDCFYTSKEEHKHFILFFRSTLLFDTKPYVRFIFNLYKKGKTILCATNTHRSQNPYKFIYPFLIKKKVRSKYGRSKLN
jgi:hypothetical protein